MYNKHANSARDKSSVDLKVVTSLLEIHGAVVVVVVVVVVVLVTVQLIC